MSARNDTKHNSPAKRSPRWGITVAPLTAWMAEVAAELQVRHDRLSLPDAIVLACARELRGSLSNRERGVFWFALP